MTKKSCPICGKKIEHTSLAAHRLIAHSPMKKNPIIESIVGGLGVGAGFAAGATAVKNMIGVKNPVRKGYNRKLWKNPVRWIGRVSPEQIMRDMLASNYKQWGNYFPEPVAADYATRISAGRVPGIPRGSDVKVYTVEDTGRYMIFVKEKGRP